MNDPSDQSEPSEPPPDDFRAEGADTLLPEVYDQLRALARHRMASENPGHTLQATALVHEAYMRLSADGRLKFSSRAQFFAMAAEAMRRILIENARRKGRIKHGGQMRREALNVLDLAEMPEADEFLSLHAAIERLEKELPDIAAVTRLRFYAGLSVDETAETLNISPRTVDRRWTYARAWLFRELER